MKIAVTSSDGKVVDQHFGHCSEFLILELDGAGGWRVAEKRRTEPTCRNFSHREDHVREVVELLSDCRFLLTYCIGSYPYRLFLGRGVDCLETTTEEPVTIDSAVKRLSAYLARQSAARGPEHSGGAEAPAAADKEKGKFL